MDPSTSVTVSCIVGHFNSRRCFSYVVSLKCMFSECLFFTSLFVIYFPIFSEKAFVVFMSYLWKPMPSNSHLYSEIRWRSCTKEREEIEACFVLLFFDIVHFTDTSFFFCLKVYGNLGSNKCIGTIYNILILQYTFYSILIL